MPESAILKGTYSLKIDRRKKTIKRMLLARNKANEPIISYKGAAAVALALYSIISIVEQHRGVLGMITLAKSLAHLSPCLALELHNLI